MHTVMMYLAIRRNEKVTAIAFGIDGKLTNTRYFRDGNWDVITNVMLDWTRDNRLSSDLYTGEVQ